MTPRTEIEPAAKTHGETQPTARPSIILLVAIMALVIKLCIARMTLGTNDVIAFYQFAKALEAHGLAWTYQHSILFNHPPLVGYFLQAIGWLDQQAFFRRNGLTFPFLLRFPGIIADFIVTLVVLSVAREGPQFCVPRWSLLLFAASPVSIMVSGFHGNTDPVMVMFLVLGALMLCRERPILCGLFFALSCQVKIIPLLLFPVFLFYWLEQRRARLFLISFVLTSFVFCAEPLLTSPAAFVKNVLSYGSFWGIWGITYCLRLTGFIEFSKVSFFNLSAIQIVIITVLKALIVVAVLVLVWRRRKLGPSAAIASMAYAWMIFFALSPGVSTQYLIWLAPFVLLLSPMFYALLVVSSSIFLFAFYNVTAGGLPWYFAHSTNKLNTIWTPWSLCPWLTLVGGLFASWMIAKHTSHNLRLLSLATIEQQPD